MIDRSPALRAAPAQLAELHAALGGKPFDGDNLLAVLRVDGAYLRVPCRVYYHADVLWHRIARSDEALGTLALCLGTRHHDGHVREASLRRLLPSRHRWVPAFAISLLGEYVIEVVDVVAQAFDTLDVGALRDFVHENPAFMATTRRRATSYWNEYHRRRFPDRRGYPALATLDAIERLAAGGAR